MILETINSPADVKCLSEEQTATLCRELRSFLVEQVSRTGGHLASNLGVVELTVAIHRVFDTATDRLVLDVGHQCYVHKALTGRRELFDTLRQFGGLSGFPKPYESVHDAFMAGHASDSVSVALGMARARTLLGAPPVKAAIHLYGSFAETGSGHGTDRALVGGLLGFLLYNHYPAKVFMGDTGSLFLGGAVAGLAFACDQPIALVFVGLIYVIETLSDILQVSYYKATKKPVLDENGQPVRDAKGNVKMQGKRIFKKAPIHHHFQLCGWSEKKIVLIFAGITVVMCVLAYFGTAPHYL